jgi:hypothetical protein
LLRFVENPAEYGQSGQEAGRKTAVLASQEQLDAAQETPAEFRTADLADLGLPQVRHPSARVVRLGSKPVQFLGEEPHQNRGEVEREEEKENDCLQRKKTHKDH